MRSNSQTRKKLDKEIFNWNFKTDRYGSSSDLSMTPVGPYGLNLRNIIQECKIDESSESHSVF